MMIGYARVSTDDQTTRQQIDALKAAGCERVFTEQASGATWNREQLRAMIDQLRPNDTVVVWKLDRLSRSLVDLLHLLRQIEDKESTFRSLTEGVETETAAGRMLAQMLGAIAEFERSLIRERTMAGLKRAAKEGRRGGRPPALSDVQKNAIRRRVGAGELTEADAAREYNVHRSTVHRLIHGRR